MALTTIGPTIYSYSIVIIFWQLYSGGGSKLHFEGGRQICFTSESTMEHNEQPNRIYFEWAERIFCSSSGVAPRGILGASPRSALGAPPSALPSAELFSQLPSGPSPEQPPELFLWAFPGALRSLEPYPESTPGAPSAQLPESLPGAPASTSSSRSHSWVHFRTNSRNHFGAHPGRILRPGAIPGTTPEAPHGQLPE